MTANTVFPSKRTAYRFILAVVGIVGFAGCNTLVSQKDSVDRTDYPTEKHAKVGLYYFLPKAQVTIEGKPGTGATDPFTVTTTVAMVADSRHRYHLRWTQNPFYDDAMANPITTDANGLLTSVNFSATDQTPAIVNDLAATAVNVFKIMGHGAPQSGELQLQGAPQKLAPFRYVFDPLDQAEVDEVQKALTAMGVHFQICPSTGRAQSCIGAGIPPRDPKAAPYAEEDTGDDTAKSGGVVYHPPVTVEMRYDFRPASQSMYRSTIIVPDPKRVACFRFGRSPFVNRTTSLTLAAGMPSGFSVNRPSPLHGFTSMLSTVSKTIADAIPTIVNVKTTREINDANEQKALATSQGQLSQALTTKLQNDQALAAAQAAAAKAAGGQQSGRVPELAPANGFTPGGQSGLLPPLPAPSTSSGPAPIRATP